MKTNFFIDCSLRKVKIEQRKLHDNSNTLVDMAKVTIIIYFLLATSRQLDYFC